ncbi:MAG: hypothetical protein A3F13_02645 [Gammaproteobacteria bacterium RIFCSPHIGHO2_12_FULL_40_19]|nr:MAG: hypothetical protein A3F13_02645 [Gammaproteobacteria bacterium RIFCSPHIGHO2_12_FULL_40_19]
MIQVIPEARGALETRQQMFSGLEKALYQANQQAVEQQEYQRNRGRLQDAFKQIEDQPKGDFISKLGAIAPALLATPGGAQVLGELAPLMQRQATQQAQLDAIRNQKASTGAQGEGQAAPQGMQQTMSSSSGIPAGVPSGEASFRYPQAPKSSSTAFPERTIGPQPNREMSPQEIENQTLDLMEQSTMQGNPMDYQTAASTVNQKAQQIRDYNQEILRQKEQQDMAQKAVTSGVVERADNAGLLKTPEDRTIAEKLALEARGAENDTERWEYVRSGLRDFNTARETIRREIGAQDPVSQGLRKLTGSYKTKEKAIADIQPQIQKFKKYGLINELRNFLTDDVGLGSEDTESAIFPLEGDTKKGLDSFVENPNRINRQMSPGYLADLFPGGESKLSQENFLKFKDGLSDYLNKNPSVNLVALRAKLNQDKRYDWQDVSSALNDLIKERRFTPDYIQDQQLQVVDQAPLPGFMQIFKYYLQGTK